MKVYEGKRTCPGPGILLHRETNQVGVSTYFIYLYPPITARRPPALQKPIIAGQCAGAGVFVSTSLPEHGIRHPACWQQLRLVCEHHLPSRKDNQPTGVFNLKYARWTIDHFEQPLRTAQRQDWTLLQSLTGKHISSVVLIYCHSNGSITFPTNSHKIKSTVALCFN